jgi:sulfate adenylyltransferase (ADP) / ATP adenylyltransferase
VTALWPAIAARSDAALRAGALAPIASERALLPEQGVRFAVRVLAGPHEKDRAAAVDAGGDRYPFDPPEPALTVGDVSATHVCVLNKYPILPHHALLVTRASEPQDAYLNLADFEALALGLTQGGAFVFYNSGPLAGASQRHKHLQLVPAPLGEGPEAMPIEPLLAAGRLPFRAAAARLDGLEPPLLLRRYLQLLSSLDLAGAVAPSRPYNLLATREWLVLVPRSRERFEGIPVNALGFAGALLARGPADLERLRAVGPLAALCAVGERL